VVAGAFTSIGAAIVATAGSAAADTNQCPASGTGNPQVDNMVGASFTTNGNTVTYIFDSFIDESSTGGVPGLIAYCIYPTPQMQPDSTTVAAVGQDGSAWVEPPSFDNFSFQRPDGNPANIALDGTQNITMGTATWNSGVPEPQKILLHINDPAECNALYGGNPGTCFVLPGSGVINLKDLAVSKTASPSFTRTYSWGISKAVDKTELDIKPGGTATFNYTVNVTHDDGTDSSWQVTGTITVSNPNSVDFSGVTVTDSSNGNGSCTVQNGSPAQIPANGSATFPYTCTYSSNPSSVTDTATATWDTSTYDTPSGAASGAATADFTGLAPKTIIDGSVDVTDTLGGDLGTVTINDPSPTALTYSHTFSGDSSGTCTSHDNTATFTTDTTNTTGSASKSVKVCVGANLTVTKTATPSFTRTYTWGISKAVDQTEIDMAAGGTATFHYTVNVTHDSGTDSNWLVTGVIKVSNPNDWEGITLSNGGLTDIISNGGTCIVQDGTVEGGASGIHPSNGTIPASSTVDFPYTCTYGAAGPSPSAFSNTATANWDASAAATTDGLATGPATGDFSTPTTIVDGSVHVTDTLGGDLGTVSYTDPSPTPVTYQKSFQGVSRTCTSYENTATFTTDTTNETGSASKSVKVCVGVDLTVGKTATPKFTRTYNWALAKTVTPALIEKAGGGTATATYKVTVQETGYTDSGWQVSGDITVTNPNDWEGITLTGGISDVISNGGSCTVQPGTVQPSGPGGIYPASGTIPASSTVDFPYTCTYSAAPSPSGFTNTATAVWSGAAAFTPHGSAQGTASGNFDTPSTRVNQTVTPTDSFNGGAPQELCLLDPSQLCQLTAVDAAPFTTATYNYTRSVNVPTSNCQTYVNTASITGQQAQASIEVCGPAKTGALTMGFWQNKNGQTIIKNYSGTNCQALATWLRKFHPFSDLTATACGSSPSLGATSASGVVGYIYTVIKNAVCTSTSKTCNSMLKAQMLATALNVYFSDPALGGNRIGAPAPIGNLTIDLTKICQMIDGSGGTATCPGTYENASSAFGGSASLTVLQMLQYQNTADPAADAGAVWYGQVKATQVLAKDAFDAINNQVAFSP